MFLFHRPLNRWVVWPPRRAPHLGPTCGAVWAAPAAGAPCSAAEQVSGLHLEQTWWILSREALLNFSHSCREIFSVKTCKNRINRKKPDEKTSWNRIFQHITDSKQYTTKIWRKKVFFNQKRRRREKQHFSSQNCINLTNHFSHSPRPS